MSSAQSIQHFAYDTQCRANTKLDGRNGFKNFRFGDSISKYKSQLQTLNGSNEFELTVNEPSSLFNIKWEKLYGLAENDKLKSIAVFWNDNETIHKSLLKNLEAMYGESFVPKIKKLKKEGFEVNAWQGNNIKMILYHDTKNISPKACTNCNVVLVIYCTKFPDVFESDF